jgi:hypothetical protein
MLPVDGCLMSAGSAVIWVMLAADRLSVMAAFV